MSTDRYIYAGIYLEVGKIRVEHQKDVRGCEQCKTTYNGHDKFCGRCGEKILNYKKPDRATSFNQLADLAIDQGVIDEETHDDIFETFWTEYNFILPENEDNVGTNNHVSYDTVQITMPEQTDLTMLHAMAMFQPVIAILDHFNVKYEAKTGILYYTR